MREFYFDAPASRLDTALERGRYADPRVGCNAVATKNLLAVDAHDRRIVVKSILKRDMQNEGYGVVLMQAR